MKLPVSGWGSACQCRRGRVRPGQASRKVASEGAGPWLGQTPKSSPESRPFPPTEIWPGYGRDFDMAIPVRSGCGKHPIFRPKFSFEPHCSDQEIPGPANRDPDSRFPAKSGNGGFPDSRPNRESGIPSPIPGQIGNRGNGTWGFPGLNEPRLDAKGPTYAATRG